LRSDGASSAVSRKWPKWLTANCSGSTAQCNIVRAWQQCSAADRTPRCNTGQHVANKEQHHAADEWTAEDVNGSVHASCTVGHRWRPWNTAPASPIPRRCALAASPSRLPCNAHHAMGSMQRCLPVHHATGRGSGNARASCMLRARCALHVLVRARCMRSGTRVRCHECLR
jgi:hypothetical protein